MARKRAGPVSAATRRLSASRRALQRDERISGLLARPGDGLPALALVGHRGEGRLRLHVRDRVGHFPRLRLDISEGPTAPAAPLRDPALDPVDQLVRLVWRQHATEHTLGDQRGLLIVKFIANGKLDSLIKSCHVGADPSLDHVYRLEDDHAVNAIAGAKCEPIERHVASQ